VDRPDTRHSVSRNFLRRTSMVAAATLVGATQLDRACGQRCTRDAVDFGR
jgi:hypothetical protein